MEINVYQSTEEHYWSEIRSRPSFAAPNLTVTKEEKRVFKGFGSCANELGIKALFTLPEEEQHQLLTTLYSPEGELKFTYCRLPIGANDFSETWYSYNEVDGDLAMEQFSIARDERYILPYVQKILEINPAVTFCASPWSPPTWMKTTKVHNHGYIRMEDDILTAYALYLVKYVQAYAEKGIPIHQLHVQNEVVSNHVFPSCKWTGEMLRDFIKEYLGPAFDAHQLTTTIWLSTINAPHPRIEWKQKITEDFDAYAGLVLDDDKAYQYIEGIGYQWAGRDAIQKTVEAYPEKEYLQTECECGDGENTWFYAQYLFNLYRHYIVNGVNGFLYWNGILPNGGASSWGTNQNSLMSVDTECQSVTKNPEFYLTKHFSTFVAPNAVRLVTTGSHTANCVTFKNPDGSLVIIVANRKESQRPLIVEVNGNKFEVSLAPQSFTTLVCQKKKERNHDEL